MSANLAETIHSKAFESLAREPDDIVGLLAYALYKKNINERRSAGKPAPMSEQRNPERTEIEAYRGQAENLLRAFAEQAIKSEKASIIADGLSNSVNDIKAEIKFRTGFWFPGVLVGIVAWLISIGITVLLAFSKPDWVAALVNVVSKQR